MAINNVLFSPVAVKKCCHYSHSIKNPVLIEKTGIFYILYMYIKSGKNRYKQHKTLNSGRWFVLCILCGDI